MKETTLVWHKYSEEKPENPKSDYLIFYPLDGVCTNFIKNKYQVMAFAESVKQDIYWAEITTPDVSETV